MNKIKITKSAIAVVIVAILPSIFVQAIAGAAAPYTFSSHTFTNCTATGMNGPTLANCQSAYSSATWSSDTSNFNVISGIQYWTVPMTGDYVISAAGAKGGAGYSSLGGLGAVETGTFTLNQGAIIRILVGQTGVSVGGMGSGGGGTYVVATPYNTNLSILLIAGGGGGGYVNTSCPVAAGGQITTNSTGGSMTGASGGGGGGGTARAGSSGFTNGTAMTGTVYAGGGAGFGGNGGAYNGGNSASGLAFINGGTGGPATNSGPIGGFGGGGSGGDRPGGGGGYSGGNSENSTCATGGSSYNNGANIGAAANINSGMGYVTISLAVPPVLSLSASNSPVYRTNVTLTASADRAGMMTFYANQKRIPNCIKVSLSGSGNSYSATCTWRPSIRGPISLSADFFPNNSSAASASTSLVSVGPAQRSNRR